MHHGHRWHTLLCTEFRSNGGPLRASSPRRLHRSARVQKRPANFLRANRLSVPGDCRGVQYTNRLAIKARDNQRPQHCALVSKAPRVWTTYTAHVSAFQTKAETQISDQTMQNLPGALDHLEQPHSSLSLVRELPSMAWRHPTSPSLCVMSGLGSGTSKRDEKD